MPANGRRDLIRRLKFNIKLSSTPRSSKWPLSVRILSNAALLFPTRVTSPAHLILPVQFDCVHHKSNIDCLGIERCPP